MKKIKVVLLAVCLLVLLGTPVYAAPITDELQETVIDSSNEGATFVNPVYSHIPAPSGQASQKAVDGNEKASTKKYKDADSAAEYLKDRMVNRKDIVDFQVYSTKKSWATVFNDVLNEACESTGTTRPYEGDYLKWNFYQFSSMTNQLQKKSGSGYYYVFSGVMTYMTTAKEEKIVTDRVNGILTELGVAKTSTEYQKVSAIYNYVTSHVSYDYATLNDSSLGKYSAYNALTKGTAICQGYANLIYRMMRQVGLSVRFIGGRTYTESHAWNIVRINGKYYNMDSTWDADYTPTTYRWFLKGTTQFVGHMRDEAYNTPEFLQKYPMSQSSFVSKDSKPFGYGITYHLNGGKNNPQNPSKYFGNAILLKSPSRAGYSFQGWYTNKKMTKKIKTIPSYGARNYTLYAKWKKITVKKATVAYFKNEKGRLRVSLKKCAGVKGYRIEYSSNKGFAKGTVKYAYMKGNGGETLVTVSNGNKRYYVRARAYKIDSKGKRVYGKVSQAVTGGKITYKLNGGKNAISNPFYFYKRGTILKQPTREGYQFVGWYSDSKYKKRVTKISGNSLKNHRLYAKWKKIAS